MSIVVAVDVHRLLFVSGIPFERIREQNSNVQSVAYERVDDKMTDRGSKERKWLMKSRRIAGSGQSWKGPKSNTQRGAMENWNVGGQERGNRTQEDL